LKGENMAKQDKLFVPYTQSKSIEERIAYVKANPSKYMPLPLKNKLDELDKKMDLILSKITK